MNVPQLSDDRLRITLYAADPDIVTPIACVVDMQDRLYVIESHTHSPPSEYPGPDGDLIKVFEGSRLDGRFAERSVFADGIYQAQSLGIAPNGDLYVVCTREVLILHDDDGDGRAEARTRVLHLDPYEKRGNPHGQMMGIAFSNDGWLYVGTGTTSDDWIGSDGRRLVVGPYWGGIIARCQRDGTSLERVAWGFWNPFSMTFDRHGRLIAIDNDPDHRGPNRLLHIVAGGDYGFKRTYGRYGLHPYQSWNGELPGTQPMIDEIGEAPTAVIDANRAALPPDYRDTMIGASWGEHNLTLYRPRPAGASLRASREIFLKGLGHDEKESPFRPSGMAVSPVDGSIYISDWMLIEYTTHLRGRIWRISTAPGVPTMTPRPPYAPQKPTAGQARMLGLADAAQVDELPALQQALKDDDPFIRNAAVTALSRPVFRDKVIQDLEHEDGKIRLGALLALRRADVENPAPMIGPRLADPDLEVARMAMVWAGEEELRLLADRIDTAASKPDLNKVFFETWLATMQIMQNSSPKGPLRTEFLEKLAQDEDRPLFLRAMAIRWLPEVDTAVNHEFLTRVARRADPVIRTEAIRRLAESTRPSAAAVLREIALDRHAPASLRAEALASLSGHPDPSLLPLLDDPDPSVGLETARALRAMRTDQAVMAAARKKFEEIRGNPNERRLKSQLEFLVAPDGVSRPETVREWQRLLAEGGDPDAGRRVFFSAHAACSTCHISEGRGVRPGGGGGAGFTAMHIGPEVSVIGRTADRDAIVHSIVKPSDYIAPEYQGWFVRMKNGELHTGRNIDQARNAIQLIMLDGHEHDFPREQIASWGAMENSLMPDGLPQGMALEEFRDLVAYLESLR